MVKDTDELDKKIIAADCDPCIFPLDNFIYECVLIQNIEQNSKFDIGYVMDRVAHINPVAMF